RSSPAGLAAAPPTRSTRAAANACCKFRACWTTGARSTPSSTPRSRPPRRLDGPARSLVFTGGLLALRPVLLALRPVLLALRQALLALRPAPRLYGRRLLLPSAGASFRRLLVAGARRGPKDLPAQEAADFLDRVGFGLGRVARVHDLF